MKKSICLIVTALLLVGCGSRSLGNKIDDQFIAPQISSEIARSNPDLNDTTSHIVVTSYNGVVLLAGQTPRAELKALAERAALRVTGIKRVQNELQIAQPSTALARSADAMLTTRIKAAMLADPTIPSSQIKIVTENGMVFLMGIVTRAEAARATSLVQATGGVQRIVRLFEYTN